MPGGDRTGPVGQGPRSGRGAGYCSGFDAPGFAYAGPRRDYWGCGWGGGRGRRNRFYATGMTGWQRAGWGRPQGYYGVNPAAYPFRPSREQEVDSLRAQAGYFEDALRDIRKRLEDLEMPSKGDNV